MNKKMFRNILIVAILLFFLMINNSVFAAGSFSLNKTSATITEGKTTTFSINGSGATGRVDITSSDTSVATVSSPSEWLENSSSIITITAKKAGTATITVTGTVADSEGAEATITKTVKVTVKAKETTSNSSSSNSNSSSNTNSSSNSSNSSSTTTTKEKSNNAYLSTLGVTPKEYDFSGFSKTKTSYSVTVPKNVDSLKVLYKTADSNAKVKVSGNSGFEVGSDNKITIKVTAEDGKTTKTYTIKVTKLAEEEEKPGNLIENEEDIYLKKLSVEGIDLSPVFVKDTYSYTATLIDASISEVKVVAEANNENVKIDISGNTNLIEGENTINILLTMEESTVQKVYQIVVTKEVMEDTGVAIPEENEDTGTTDLIGKLKSYAGIAIGVILLIVVAVILLIILLVRENKKTREEEKIETTKAEEYNVYQNDENEFINNEVQKDNFIESLYKQRNENLDNEDLTKEEKETLEEISKQTEKIFEEKIEGQSVEYSSNEEIIENSLEIRKRRRGKGKHSL